MQCSEWGIVFFAECLRSYVSAGMKDIMKTIVNIILTVCLCVAWANLTSANTIRVERDGSGDFTLIQFGCGINASPVGSLRIDSIQFHFYV